MGLLFASSWSGKWKSPEPLLPAVNRANTILTQASARYLQKQAPRPAQEKRQQVEVQQEKV